MVKISKKRAVILDFVKTLVKEKLNWNKLREENAKVFNKYGINIDPQTLRPVIQQTACQIKFLKYLRYTDEQILQIEKELIYLHRKFEKESIEQFSLFEDTIPFINYVNKHNLKIGILTDNCSSTVKEVFLKLKVPFYGEIIGREDVEQPKPSSEGMEKLLEKLKVAASDCFAIGDSDFDIDVAKQKNISAFFLKRTENFKLNYTTPDYTISSLSEVILDD